MPTIILNNSNTRHPRALQQDRERIEALQDFFRSKGVDMRMEYSNSFPQLEGLLDARDDVVLVFSNFPPDVTYTDDFEETERPGFGTMILAVKADGYARSKEKVKALCARHARVPFVIITGAPRATVTDGEILGLGATGQIIVKRKSALFGAREDFESAYLSYLAAEANYRLGAVHDEGTGEWRRTQLNALKRPQFGAIRVLLLNRDAAFASALARHFPECFDVVEPVFTFIPAGDIETAHRLLLDYPLEMVLSMSHDPYWLALLRELTPDRVPFGVACVVPFDHGDVELPPGVTPFSLDESSGLQVRDLMSGLLKMVESRRDEMRECGRLPYLQGRFLDLLQNESTYHALRSLTVNHNEFVEAVASEGGGLNLFLPTPSVRGMRALIRKAVFAADRSVFTFLAPSRAVETGTLREGSPITIAGLWDVYGAPLASMFEHDLRDLILEHRKLFDDGRVLFYPSPSLVRIGEANVDQASPGVQSVVRGHPDLPLWQENKFHTHYVSADNFNAHHVVLAEYKRLAEIGAALAQLEIPYVDNVPAGVLGSIVEDNTESLANFRERIRRAMEDILDARADPERDRTRRQFARDLQDSTEELQSRLSALRKSNALQQAGALFLTAFATLAAVSPLDIPASVAALVGGGGLGSMGLQYLGYLQQLKEIKRSPFYIVWRMSQEQPPGP